ISPFSSGFGGAGGSVLVAPARRLASGDGQQRLLTAHALVEFVQTLRGDADLRGGRRLPRDRVVELAGPHRQAAEIDLRLVRGAALVAPPDVPQVAGEPVLPCRDPRVAVEDLRGLPQ